MKISFPSRNDRRVGTRARLRSSPSRRRLARASVSRARAIDDDVILPSFPSPFSPSVPSRDSSRPVPTLHRHLDTVPRSVGRAGDADAISRRRRKAPAGVVVARGAHRATTQTRREDGEEDVGRETPTARRPRRVVRAPRGAHARHFHIRMSSTRARGRGNDARDIHSTRARRPSSVVVETRRERVQKKTGARRVPRALDSRVRSFARARATMWRATTARGAAFRRSRPGPSLRFIFLYVRVDTALKRV